MANLGKDLSASVPEQLRSEVEALEGDIAAATGTIVAPVASTYVPPEGVAVSDPLLDAPASPDVVGDGLRFNAVGVEPAEPVVDDGALKDVEIEQLNQRLRTLQGKYDAEMPRLSEELRESKETIRAFEDKHSGDLTSEKVSDMSDTEFMDTFNVTQDQMAYGREVLEFTIGQNLDMQRQLREQIVQPLHNKSISDAQQRMQDELGRLVPKWDSVNSSSEFKSYLGVRPGEQHLLDAAAEKFDAQSAADVFRRFTGTYGQVDTQHASLASQIAPAPVSSSTGAQVRSNQQPNVVGGLIPKSNLEMSNTLDRLTRGEREDGSKITDVERQKELANLDEITRGAGTKYVIVP